MKSHVQSRYTSRPQLFVHLTPEEVLQLEAGLGELVGGASLDRLTPNQRDALVMLWRELQHRLSLPPHQNGLKGVMP